MQGQAEGALRAFSFLLAERVRLFAASPRILRFAPDRRFRVVQPGEGAGLSNSGKFVHAPCSFKNQNGPSRPILIFVAERVRFEAATTTHNQISRLHIQNPSCVPLKCTRKCTAPTPKIPTRMNRSVIEVAALIKCYVGSKIAGSR
jgi:hypothetical protein